MFFFSSILFSKALVSFKKYTKKKNILNAFFPFKSNVAKRFEIIIKKEKKNVRYHL